MMICEVVNFEKKILVTSALPYVNNVPHLGTMVCIVSADVYTRFLRLQERKVLSVLGTDEHGTTTEAIALKMGLSPQEATDYFFKIHKQVYDWFNCDFDCFGRTSCPESVEITQDIFLKIFKNGFISEKEEEQFFDLKAQKFLSDRFIEGSCPFCKYADARGDQCDSCGKLLDPKELINPRSKLTGSVPVLKKTRHLYIKLHDLQPLLEKHISKVNGSWSENALTTTNAWLKEGLKERAITRDLKWGIPVPLKGFEDKVFYVWFDAPIGYISITKANREDWKDWWLNPDETRLVQFMGKDNIPFHSVLFPASLIATGEKFTLVDTLNVNEYLNYENDKFSKSRGVGVFGDNIQESGIPADAWRYYLMMNRPEKNDTDFSWKDFQDKINNELVGNFGNLVNRTLTFINKFCDSNIFEIKEKGISYEKDLSEIIKFYESVELKRAVKSIMALSKRANQFFQDKAPWKKIKENPEEAKSDLALLANIIKDLALVMHPIMPETSEHIFEQLNFHPKSFNDFKTKLENHKINQAKPLFSKVDDAFIANLISKYSGKQSLLDEKDLKNVETESKKDLVKKPLLKVAVIKEVSKHPNADKLFVEKISFGDEERTIVSGLSGHYEMDDLVGKKIIVVSNLKPAVLRGVKSEGMLLAVSQGKEVGLLLCPNAEPGTRLFFDGFENDICSEEISIDNFFSFDILANKDGVSAEGLKLKGADIIVDKHLSGKAK